LKITHKKLFHPRSKFMMVMFPKTTITLRRTSRRTGGMFFLSANHGQQHFESLRRFERMRLTGRQDDGLTIRKVERVAGYKNIGFTIQYLHQRIKWSSMFAQFLPGIEGKQGDIPGFSLGDLATNDRAFLVSGHIGQCKYFSFWGG